MIRQVPPAADGGRSAMRSVDCTLAPSVRQHSSRLSTVGVTWTPGGLFSTTYSSSLTMTRSCVHRHCLSLSLRAHRQVNCQGRVTHAQPCMEANSARCKPSNWWCRRAKNALGVHAPDSIRIDAHHSHQPPCAAPTALAAVKEDDIMSIAEDCLLPSTL